MSKEIKRLYIAGPMRGIPDNNFPAFNDAAQTLRKKGYEVWNPAEEDAVLQTKGELGEFSFAKAMARDLPWVCWADAVAVLPGWEKSQGARIETGLARELGKPILVFPEMKPVADWKPTNAKDVVAMTKLDLSLFPDTAAAYGSLAMAEGDYKYGAFNYRPSGVLASIYVAALRRHLAKWWNGQDADPKTQVPHLGSVLACAAILIDSIECGVLQDDRPPRVNMEETIAKLEKVGAHLRTIFPNKPPRYTEKKTA